MDGLGDITQLRCDGAGTLFSQSETYAEPEQQRGDETIYTNSRKKDR